MMNETNNPNQQSKPTRSYPEPPKGSKRWREQQREKILNDLNELDRKCQNMIAHAAELTPYLQNKELVNAGDKEQISTQAQILSRDLKNIRHELELIRAARPRDIDPEDPEDISLTLDIGQRYENWQNRYLEVLMPTITRLNDLLIEANENFHRQNQNQDLSGSAQ